MRKVSRTEYVIREHPRPSGGVGALERFHNLNARSGVLPGGFFSLKWPRSGSGLGEFVDPLYGEAQSRERTPGSTGAAMREFLVRTSHKPRPYAKTVVFG